MKRNSIGEEENMERKERKREEIENWERIEKKEEVKKEKFDVGKCEIEEGMKENGEKRDRRLIIKS